jgi:hypothetical protein
VDIICLLSHPRYFCVNRKNVAHRITNAVKKTSKTINQTPKKSWAWAWALFDNDRTRGFISNWIWNGIGSRVWNSVGAFFRIRDSVRPFSSIWNSVRSLSRIGADYDGYVFDVWKDDRYFCFALTWLKDPIEVVEHTFNPLGDWGSKCHRSE